MVDWSNMITDQGSLQQAYFNILDPFLSIILIRKVDVKYI